MKIYYFGGTIEMVDMLHENGFDGNLFLSGSQHSDDFVKIARFMDAKKDFKYMVAMRSYTISPQYLSLICKSFHQMSLNKIQINLLAGHVKESEKSIGGVIGPINDLSSSIEKSKYLIEFLETMHKTKLYKPDLYVSCTNKYTYDIAKKYNYKIILPYPKYFNKEYGDNIDLKNVMISFAPIIKENGEYLDININEQPEDQGFYTTDSLTLLLDNFKKSGVSGVLMARRHTSNKPPSLLEIESDKLIKFVKNYKNK